MKTLAFSLSLFALSPAASATIVRGVSLEELYDESSIVISGVIESGRVLPKDCGVVYTIRIERRYKGEAKAGDVLTVEKYGPAQVGAKYFFFLSKTTEEFRPILSTNSGAMNRRAEYIERCKDLRPAYTVNIWGNGALKVTGTYNGAVKEAVVFDDYLVKPDKSLVVTTLGPRDRYDNDRNDSAMEVGAFSDYLKQLSDDD